MRTVSPTCSVLQVAGVVCCAVLLLLGEVRAQVAPPAVYVVEEGDTLYGIAREHGLTVDELRRLNELEGSTIYPGQELRVQPQQQSAQPQGSRADTSAAGSAPTGADAVPAPTATPFYGSHTVEPGATFYTIAARYGTSVDSLVALNDSVKVFLEPGQEIRLPVALGPPAHTVASGETIYDVAQRYGVSAKLIQHLNDLEHMTVREGQHLRIPGREAPAPQPRGTRRPVRETGPVTRYPASYEGRLMAGGARYDPERFVVSHSTLPIGTVVLLTNPANAHQTFAVVADRGPLDEQYVMDVSAAVHERLGLAEASFQAIDVRVMD